MVSDGDVEVIYATFHVDIGETPFFVAVDYAKEKIVVSIRGTLSMKDILTDLNAEGEPLPLTPQREVNLISSIDCREQSFNDFLINRIGWATREWLGQLFISRINWKRRISLRKL